MSTTLTPTQAAMLRSLADGRLPTYGVPLNRSIRSGVNTTLRALERRDMVVKWRGRWIITISGMEAIA